jgi:hypothetical protein
MRETNDFMTTLLNRRSLARTLDAVSESLFFSRSVPAVQRRAVTKWIAGRQGLPGAYADTFAPTEKDTLGIHLFTGEAIRSRVGIGHILGEESCRALLLLGGNDPLTKSALRRAVRGLAARIEEWEKRGNSPGFYCCGACSAAYWRNLATGLMPCSDERLRLGLGELMNLRHGGGKWRRFPFFYTCLALTEIGPRLAKTEMQYAAIYWQRNLKKLSLADDRASKRRAAVGQRLLKMCEREA